MRELSITCLVLGLLVWTGCPVVKKRHNAPADTTVSVDVPAISTPPPDATSSAEASAPIRLGAVGEIPLVPLRVAAFSTLTRQQQFMAYHLIQACEAGSRILYAQHHRNNLEIKDLLETLLLAKTGLQQELRRRMEQYLQRFWLNRGHHDLRTKEKFVAPFSLEQLRTAARDALERRIDLGVLTPIDLERLLRRLKPFLIDANVQPMLVSDTPDRLNQHSIDFYRGVTAAQARAFKHRHPRNSRLVRLGGALVEQVWRAGGDGAPEGVYVNELHHVIKHLHRALPLAAMDQRQGLQQLIQHLTTGEQQDRDRALALLGRIDSPVEVVLGFIPTHRDPLGLKGTYQCMVGACAEPAEEDNAAKGTRARRCELLFASGDPGPDGRWQAMIGSKRLEWTNLPGDRGDTPGMEHVPPVYLASRNTRGDMTDVKVFTARSWTRYNLARARAWRMQNARPLVRPPARLPVRAPADRLQPRQRQRTRGL